MEQLLSSHSAFPLHPSMFGDKLLIIEIPHYNGYAQVISSRLEPCMLTQLKTGSLPLGGITLMFVTLMS